MTTPARSALPAPAPTPVPQPKRRSSGTITAGIAFLLAITWVFSFVVVGAGDVVRVGTAFAGGVVAPVLAAIVLRRRAASWLGTRRGLALIVLVAVAFATLALVAVAFSSAIDDADAGRAAGLLGSLTWIFGLVSVLSFAATIALALELALRRTTLANRARIGIAVAVGLVAAPFVAWTLLSPVPVALLCLAVFVITVVPVGLATRPPAREPAPREPPALATRERVTTLAGFSLAVTLAVWSGGLAVSIAGTGTPAATSGLGIAAALGQLAVIPLLWALSLVLATRSPRLATWTWRGCVVACGVVGLMVVVMVAGYSPDGDLFLGLVAVLSVGVGLWGGALAWALCDRTPTVARAAIAVVAVLALAFVYAIFVGLSGGVVLALASGFVAFGGSRLLLRTARA